MCLSTIKCRPDFDFLCSPLRSPPRPLRLIQCFGNNRRGTSEVFAEGREKLESRPYQPSRSRATNIFDCDIKFQATHYDRKDDSDVQKKILRCDYCRGGIDRLNGKSTRLN